MRVAVIGCGSIGSRHARNLKALGASLFVMDTEYRRAFELDRELSADGSCDAIRLLARDIEDKARELGAALICTPAHTHATVARELLEHGYRGPLFVEKPIALTAEEAEVFTSWPHPTLMVGYNWRFNRDVTAWQQRWNGVTPSQVTLTCQTDCATWPGRGYADPILECSHELDLAFAIFGPTLHLVDADIRTAGAQLYLQTLGTVVRVDLFWKARHSRRSFVARFRNNDVVRHDIVQPASIDQSYVHELEHFLDCAASQKRPDCTAMDGVRVLDVLKEAAARV